MTVIFRGRRACECLAEWLPVFEKELLRRGVIKRNIDIAQLIGGASQSAGTHSKGGAFDIWQRDLTTIKVARQMGADATWKRTPAQGFSYHTHGVLRGCPHNTPARYQIGAVDAGYNGLGRGGRGGRDDGPRPLSGRSWREGIAWAKAQGNDEPDDPMEEIMGWYKDKAEFEAAIAKAVWDYKIPSSVPGPNEGKEFEAESHLRATNQKVYEIVDKLDAGGDADPKAPDPAPEPETPAATYTVVPGDTLGKIATKHNIKLADLVAWNDIDDPNVIEVGQNIRLAPPEDGGSAPKG